MLYDQSLLADHGQVCKTKQCCRATAGFESVIEVQPEAPTIKPSELMKATIDLYKSTVEALLKQGYPRPLAEKAAEKHILNEK